MEFIQNERVQGYNYIVLPFASVFTCAAGYDCGVYLVCFAEQVVRQVLLKDTHTPTDSGPSSSEGVEEEDVEQY